MPSKGALILLAAALVARFLVAAPACAASKESVLYSFCSQPDCADGGAPLAALVFDAAGNLYGTTWGGGANAPGGTVFQLARGADGTWTEKVLYSFCSRGPNCHDGFEPAGNLIFDAHGNLYGTTQYGGYAHNSLCDVEGCGTVFRLKPEANGTWTEEVLHKFGVDDTDGIYPVGGLVFDDAGNLYGITKGGGAYGTVFQLSPGQHGKWTETVLYSFFPFADGGYPVAGPAIDASGNLYGTTTSGGTGCKDFNCGTVFRLGHRHGEWAYNVIHSFQGTDGSVPSSTPTLDAAGNLYVTCPGGGRGNGTVVEIMPDPNGKWTEKVLRSFHQVRDPEGSLVLDSDGNLYGMTQFGGRFNDCCGTAFKLSPGGNGKWSETTLHSFGSDGDGIAPTSSLIFDAAGNLYGTTSRGGANNGGVVFEITP